MDRPSFIGCLSASAAVSLLAGCAALREPAPDEPALVRPPARRPNIILIMADDVGIEGFGCYGGTSYETPAIDGLARDGVRFAQCAGDRWAGA
jgi:hypothetical protein